MDPNPYAPPATSEPDRPEDDQHHPVRRLWPLYPMALLLAAAVHFWAVGRDRTLRQRHGDQAAARASGYGGLAGDVLATLPVALLGDGRGARLLLAVGLLLVAATTALGLLPADQPLATAIHGLGVLGSAVCGLLLTACLLRGVTVRGVYVAMLLFDIVQRGGDALAVQLRRAMQMHLNPNAALLLAALCALLCLVPLLWLREPAALTVPEGLEDPLGRDPLSRGAALGLVSLESAFFVLAMMLNTFGRSHLPDGAIDETLGPALAALLGLLLPISAYYRRWRPRSLAVAGALVTAAGGLLLGGSRIFDHLPRGVAVLGDSLRAVGYLALFGTGSGALLRQSLPVERIARWCALRSLCWTGLRVVLRLPGAPGPATLGASALLIPVGLGLLWLTRGR